MESVMLDTIFDYLPFIFFGLIILGIGYSFFNETQRNKGLFQYSLDNSLDYFKNDDSALDLIRIFKVYRHDPNSERGKNILKGSSEGVDFTIFDYKYTVGSGKNKQTYNQTVFFSKDSKFDLTEFYMCPEGVAYKLKKVIGKDDINFRDYPQFSKKYNVEGVDSEEVRNLFSDRIPRYFDKRFGWSVEGFKNEIIIYKKRKRVGVKDLKEFIDNSVEITKLFRG